MASLKIGIFDSGIGGLTVLNQAVCTLPGLEYLYYADTDHVPYGLKSKKEIIQYVDESIQFMISKKVEIIVIACNTATSVAIDYLRKKYSKLPILGMEPAAKAALNHNHDKRVMLIATPVTIKDEKLKNLLSRVDEQHFVDLLPLPNLVNYAEKEMFHSAELIHYLRSELSKYQLDKYAALVLGCTHFNYFKDTFREIFPDNVLLIDGSTGTINHLKHVLAEYNINESNETKIEYYFSGRKIEDTENLCRIERLHRRLDEMLKY